MIIKLKQATTVKETREQMLAWAAEFKAARFQMTTEGDSQARTFSAGPSKPWAMRQKNARLTATLEGFKLLAGPEKAEQMHADYRNGRVFHDRTLVVTRDRQTEELQYNDINIAKVIPEYTKEGLETKIAEAKKIREENRRPS